MLTNVLCPQSDHSSNLNTISGIISYNGFILDGNFSVMKRVSCNIVYDKHVFNKAELITNDLQLISTWQIHCILVWCGTLD